MIKQRIRKAEGQSVAEALGITVALCALIPVIADGGVVLTGFWINAEACKTAARAASMGPPSVLERNRPQQSALATLAAFKRDNAYIKFNPSILVEEKVKTPLPRPPFGGTVDGYVTVTTTVEITPPFCKSLLRRKPIELTSSESYAYTWAMPSIAR